MTGAAQVVEDKKEAAVQPAARRGLIATWGLFILIGLGFYAALYAGSEYLVYRYGEKNRFFMSATAPRQEYDFVILGASHAMPLDFADMNDKLQQASGGTILNLSNEGAGILPNRIVLDYFFEKHRTKTVVYILDSFAFYTPTWNEERIDDARLFQRAPLDPDLVQVLWRHPPARTIMWNYISGFLKINNQNRFAPDISDAEATKFTRTYRSIAQIDRQRVEYLYPRVIEPARFQQYLAEFEGLLRSAKEHGAKVVVVKPPTPARYRDKLPKEAEFDATIRPLLEANGVPFHDLSTALTEDRYFYDTDHLNRTGVTAFIDGPLGGLLRQYR